MNSEIRKSAILELAQSDGMVSVEGLATQFGVAAQTIRRDLAQLAQKGKLNRVHGGAVLPSGPTSLDYVRRQNVNAEGKARIGALCAQNIPDNASIFINIGTTTEAVARELTGHRGLLVVTNSLNIANILAANPEIDIIVAGGALRRTDGGLLGNLTTQVVDLFKFDLAVISCAAIDEDGDLLDYDLQEVNATKAITRQSKATFVVADHTKFQRRAPGKIGSLGDSHTLFTDAPVPVALRARCDDLGVRVCESDT
ncbi:DeoR/GlpR family DNA-binding transcription regulator [Ruegeria sp. 2205SS24-7]|uniref:DeoR/GlpR family DNA-binding transcription regulator n=1 Tax=Ruegeria discodermiae TaxID=3064389 RepID=UPI0027405880|nr:DeoR/GlpR family DNA-binding transcription regulator [Ruegeria sp. 2205SS24-7]MDP5217065.1 DeoR/GlpR family DNA-binding transcription regulator [Ruegeria sp. 2205SS24-7]